MPGPLDLALVLLFVVLGPLLEYAVWWPRHVRAVDAGVANARERFYGRIIIEEWLFAGAVIAVMLHAGRPLDVLWLRLPQGWRLWVGVAVPLAYGVMVLTQGRALATRPASLARLRQTLQPLRAFIPHTSREYRLFVPLGLTAGICEELLCRGYLVWVLAHWLGLWGAAGASAVLFGLAHAYLGPQHIVRAFFTGVAMSLLTLATGSLLPAMAMHALIDLGSSWITNMAVREPVAPLAASVGSAG